MKKLVFLMAICFIPNFVMAENEWPVFSNQEGAAQSLENLMVIGANKDKNHLIGSYEYTIDLFTCQAVVENANKDKSIVAEFRPGEVLSDEGTAYNLYVGDAVVEGTETMIKRQAASNEEQHDVALDGEQGDVQEKSVAKKGFCNLL